jgi:integrase
MTDMSTARFITPDERQRLLAELASPRDVLFFQLAVNTGLRVSEILGLRWRQLIRNGAPAPAFEIPRRSLKGGRSENRRRVCTRRIPINTAAAAAIREYAFAAFGSAEPPLENYVFASRKKFPGVISRKQAHRIIADAARRAGLEGTVAPHSLRRVFARACYQATNFDPVALQVLMGHANFQTSVIYIRPDPGELAHIYDQIGSPAAEAAGASRPVALTHAQ